MNKQLETMALDEQHMAELQEMFCSFDRNHDGSLTQLELDCLLRVLGLKPSADQLERLIQKADNNSNGLVEFSEFAALVTPELTSLAVHQEDEDQVHHEKKPTDHHEKKPPSPSPYTEEQLRVLFRVFDKDGDGYITAAELAHSMARLGHALTVEELTGMIREADNDGDGRISFQEFSQAFIGAAAFD
ncbi:hypothetical protein Dimus_008022 [Dionaea muscipula]